MKKTRLILGLLGIFLLCFGFVLFMAATEEMNSSTGRYYSWNPPYTEYEASVMITRTWGIVSLIIGGLMELLCIISHVYESKNVQDINPVISNAIKCSTCGIKVDRSLTTCPNCKNTLKK